MFWRLFVQNEEHVKHAGSKNDNTGEKSIGKKHPPPRTHTRAPRDLSAMSAISLCKCIV